MVRRCLKEHSAFGVVLILAGAEAGAVSEVADTGTSARLVDFDTLPTACSASPVWASGASGSGGAGSRAMVWNLAEVD